ncbi:hypothetical protein [uncultured Cetobacterium sp.]|uniref:hypothetical protein n=1 Tax=uncultured Cetobacterium sp. TaxID=527638 RepID=UPI0025D0EF20|nr:hypothetical protein [uncultured Cetobacterium sp.]
MRIIFYMFLISLNLFAITQELTLNYKANEPLLGKGHYLILSDVPVATYPNTVGYFSSVDIVGKNLTIGKDLERVIIKKDGNVLLQKNVEWEQYSFTVENIELGGLTINLRWKNLNRQKMELMVDQWNLVKGKYELEIEYQYSDRKEVLKLSINMPEFNPEIYLDFDYKTPILKKQEYGKKYLIIKKIGLNDYDLEITKNKVNSEGLKLNLAKEASLKIVQENIEKQESLENVRIVPLKEVYPNIYIEQLNDDIFNDTKEIYIGLELPQNLDLNMNYRIEGEVLSLSYNRVKKVLIDKVFILAMKNEVSKTIALDKWYIPGQKIYIDDFREVQGYYLLEGTGVLSGKYSGLKIKVNDIEEEIDEFGESEEIDLDFGRMKIENGRASICIDKLNHLIQGSEINYKIFDKNENIIESVRLKFYIEN